MYEGVVQDPSSPPVHDRRFWLNFSSLCLVLALAEGARGIVMPTLSLYVGSLGGSPSLLSVVVAAFSVGRLSSSVVYGYLSDRCSLHLLLIGSLVLACAGHVLFIVPLSIGSSAGLTLLAFARLLTGFATGTLSLARAFTSRETTDAERTKFMSWLGIVQFAGFAFTPALGGIPVNWQVKDGWVINTYVAGTYFLLLLDVALIGALGWGMARGQEVGQEVGASQIGQRVAKAEVDLPTIRAAMAVEEGQLVGRAQTRQRHGSTSSAWLEKNDCKPDSEQGVVRPVDEHAEEKEQTEPFIPATNTSYALVEPFDSQDRVSSDETKPLHLAVAPSPFHAVSSVAPCSGNSPLSASASIDSTRPGQHEALFTVSNVDTVEEAPVPVCSCKRPAPLSTLILFILLNATCRGCLAVAETYGSVLYYSAMFGVNYDTAAVSPAGAAWFYTILGGVGVVVFVLMDKFTHLIDELSLLISGFIAMSLGFSLSLDFDHDLGVVELSFSMAMIYCIATPITQTLVVSMLSKSLSKSEQGKWMGLLTAAGSVGRIVFPLLAGALYNAQSINLALMLPALIAIIAVFGIGLGSRAWQLRRRTDLDQPQRPEQHDDEAKDMEMEDVWLTIEQVMERSRRKTELKRRWRLSLPCMRGRT